MRASIAPGLRPSSSFIPPQVATKITWQSFGSWRDFKGRDVHWSEPPRRSFPRGAPYDGQYEFRMFARLLRRKGVSPGYTEACMRTEQYRYWEEEGVAGEVRAERVLNYIPEGASDDALLGIAGFFPDSSTWQGAISRVDFKRLAESSEDLSRFKEIRGGPAFCTKDGLARTFEGRFSGWTKDEVNAFILTLPLFSALDGRFDIDLKEIFKINETLGHLIKIMIPLANGCESVEDIKAVRRLIDAALGGGPLGKIEMGDARLLQARIRSIPYVGLMRKVALAIRAELQSVAAEEMFKKDVLLVVNRYVIARAEMLEEDLPLVKELIFVLGFSKDPVIAHVVSTLKEAVAEDLKQRHSLISDVD